MSKHGLAIADVSQPEIVARLSVGGDARLGLLLSAAAIMAAVRCPMRRPPAAPPDGWPV